MIKLDLTYLESISGGDQAFIKEMLGMFLKSTFPEMEELKGYATKGNWEMMGSTAHKMKAPIQMLGATAVSELVLDLETIGKTKADIQSVELKIETLKGYIRELDEQIRAFIQA